MECRGTYSFDKNIILSPERIEEIAELLVPKYCNYLKYEITVLSGTKIKLSSFDELMKQKNYKNSKITVLKILGYSESIQVIQLVFYARHISPPFVKCKYKFNEQDDEILFAKHLEEVLEKSVDGYRPYRFMSLSFLVILLTGLIWLFIKNQVTEISKILLVSFTCMCFYYLLQNKVIKFFFPPVVFLWGEEKLQHIKVVDWRKNIFWVIIVPTLMSLFSFSSILEKEIKQEINNSSFQYSDYFEWISMEEAESFWSNQSEITVYRNQSDDYYYEGAALSVLYNNLSEYERTITKFTVYAENIVADYSPVLICNDFYYSLDPIVAEVVNNGWGATGTIEAYVSSIEPFLDSDEDIVDISLRKDARSPIVFDSLKPGEKRNCSFWSEKDFLIEYEVPLTENQYYDLDILLVAKECNYQTTITIPLCITVDQGIHVGGYGSDGGKYTHYVVEVDTSNPSWSRTYNVSQPLPAKETIRLPIFIVPSQSCKMSLRIEFELDNGVIIQSKPLDNACFVIPYYDDWDYYVKGELLDWNNKKEYRRIYFPFGSLA